MGQGYLQIPLGSHKLRPCDLQQVDFLTKRHLLYLSVYQMLMLLFLVPSIYPCLGAKYPHAHMKNQMF